MGQIKRIIASILNKGVIVINNIENAYESEVIRLISDTFGAYMKGSAWKKEIILR